jgi:uncharacterized membrane protein
MNDKSGRQKEETMSDDKFDVIIAGYAAIDSAKKDFEALVSVVTSQKIKTTEGVILVEHDANGEAQVTDAADHHGRKGLAWGGGVGVLVGLFAPPLLASAVIGGAIGGLVGKFTQHSLENGIKEKIGETIPKGTAGIITLVEESDTSAVKAALGGSLKTSIVPVEGGGIKALKEGLAEAAASGTKSSGS